MSLPASVSPPPRRDPSGRFRPGRSGNPRGRPPRRPGLAERLAAMAAAEAEGIVAAAIGRAKAGDAAAAGLVLALALGPAVPLAPAGAEAAVDYPFLLSPKESLSPGFLRRQERRMRGDGQERPADPLRPFG